jgi:hypothetical protein
MICLVCPWSDTLVALPVSHADSHVALSPARLSLDRRIGHHSYPPPEDKTTRYRHRVR